MKRKIMVTYIILLLIGTFTTGFIAFQFLDTIYNNSLKDKLITNLNLLEETVLLLDEDYDHINYFNLAQKFSKKIDERVTFITQDGKVLSDSTNNSIIFEDYSKKPELLESLSGRIGDSRRMSPITGEDTFYISSLPIEVNGQRIIIRLSSSMAEIRSLNRQFVYDIMFSILFGLLVASFIGFFYINKIIRPIKDLTVASKAISKGELDRNVVVNSKDEIEELAHSFNTMVFKLRSAIDELNYKNSQLDDIMTSMINGVMAVDNSGRIIMSNPMAKKMLHIDGSSKQKLENFEIHKDIFKTIKYTLDTKIPTESEVVLDDENSTVLKIYTTNIASKDSKKSNYGVLVILQDISQMRKLENMRIEFVSNVSHELRTPLTSISGFVETLQDWDEHDEKNRKKILDIIELETERLKGLINDILTLSEIENINKAPFRASVDVEALIGQAIFLLKPISDSKSVKIVCQIEKGLETIESNPSWLKQMVLNILDNAIKYSPEGSDVVVSARRVSENLLISIKDFGIGIPSESLPRILERFYRVDKARSRKEGGTGLGLAIVKHIVMELGGSIDIKSELGKGSEFIINLPYKND